jgi:pilus assembly protein CpaE
MQKPSVLILGGDGRTQADLSRALKDSATVASAPAEGTQNLREYIASAPGAVVVVVGANPLLSFQIVAELTAAGLRVIVVSAVKDPDFILQSMRSGAREFVVESDHEGLRKAVREQAKTPEEGAPRGLVMSFFPTRGGVGATSIAANLAGALQRRGESVCLLDFDLYLGDVLSFLDLPGTFFHHRRSLQHEPARSATCSTPRDAAPDRGAGARPERQGRGGRARAPRRRPQPAGVPSPALRSHRGRRGAGLRRDVPRGAGRQPKDRHDPHPGRARGAQHQAVSRPVRRLGYPEDKIMLVLNRFQKDSKITTDVIAETSARRSPTASATTSRRPSRSINRGLMLYDVAPRSKLTKDIEALAPVLMGQLKDAGRRGGFLRNLLKRNEDGASGAS